MSTSLTLDLPEKTFKKLRALAMLSGKSVPDLEQNLLEYFDAMLSENIQVLLAELDGETYTPPTAPNPVSVVQGDLDLETPPVDAVTHALSEDDDLGENQSLAEQAESDYVPKIQAPDVGDDDDQFLDAALGPPTPMANPGIPSELRAKPAGRSFNPISRQPRISEYTGDE